MPHKKRENTGGTNRMRVLNFGSLNLDFVYPVDHFVQPGETLAAASRAVKQGGKGLNQSIALARAGADTAHAGCVGDGGGSLPAMLRENGVDVSCILPVPGMQGHTVIQVNREGENCILLYGGSNRCVTEKQVRDTIARFAPGDWLVLQNEINLLPMIVEEGARQGLVIALNPSPFDDGLRDVDFNKLAWLLVNEIEAEQITGESDSEKAQQRLHARYPRLSVLITLGGQGSMALRVTDAGVETARQRAQQVQAVDTTAAGDTYTGYFIEGLMRNLPLQACMERASKAAAISVTRPGAAASIPRRDEVDGQP